MEDGFPAPPPPAQDSAADPAQTPPEGPGALPPPPPKESFSRFYQQRQASELKRLYRHMHPELRRNLEETVAEDLADLLEAGSPGPQAPGGSDPAPAGGGGGGDVQCMRWIFDNWRLDAIGERPGPRKLTDEEAVLSGDVKATSLKFEGPGGGGGGGGATPPPPPGPGAATGAVRTARWLFETQPLDALGKTRLEETELQEAVLQEPAPRGDVQGTRRLFEGCGPDAARGSDRERSVLRLRSEIQELQGGVQKTIKLFQTEPLCALRDGAGHMHEIRAVCREEIGSAAVSAVRWLFETRPLDAINRDPAARVHVVRGISLEEAAAAGRPDVSGARWLFETQPLDAIREVTVDEREFQALPEVTAGPDVRKQRLLFETRALDSLTGEEGEARGEEGEPGREAPPPRPGEGGAAAGAVRSTLWLFETQPLDALGGGGGRCQVGRLQRVEPREEGPGDEGARGPEGRPDAASGDVRAFRALFEALPLDRIGPAGPGGPGGGGAAEAGVAAGHVRATQALFDASPLYVLQDGRGGLHRVTAVSREQEAGPGCLWLFETKPLDGAPRTAEVIRGLTREEAAAEDGRTARWFFETQLAEPAEPAEAQRGEPPKGEAPTCRWLLETRPPPDAEASGDPAASVAPEPCTWMLEAPPPLPDGRGPPREQRLRAGPVSGATGGAGGTVRRLFETEALGGEGGPRKAVRTRSWVEIPSGAVSRRREVFEAQPAAARGAGGSAAPAAGEVEPGSVRRFTWLFETRPMDGLHAGPGGIRELPPASGGASAGKRFVFETLALGELQAEVDESELPPLPRAAHACTMRFEGRPLYALRDADGACHEVTAVRKEEVRRGSARGARWVFDTSPLDAAADGADVFLLRAVTQEEGGRGAARWRFETEPLEPAARTAGDGDDAQRGQGAPPTEGAGPGGGGGRAEAPPTEGAGPGGGRGRAEAPPSPGRYVRTVSVSDQQRGHLRTSTWLFENRPLDSPGGPPEAGEPEARRAPSPAMTTVRREDVSRGGVKRCAWLFETPPPGRLRDPATPADPAAPGGGDEQGEVARAKSTTWLFENAPRDRPSASPEGPDGSVRASLRALHACGAVRRGGVVIEAHGPGRVRLARYQLDGPGPLEVLKEETVAGDLRDVLGPLLQRERLERPALLAEGDARGEVRVSPLQLPEPSGPGAAGALGLLVDRQDAAAQKGLVLQEAADGAVGLVVFSLPRAGAELGLVRLFANCIERGDLSHLGDLRRDREAEVEPGPGEAPAPSPGGDRAPGLSPSQSVIRVAPLDAPAARPLPRAQGQERPGPSGAGRPAESAGPPTDGPDLQAALRGLRWAAAEAQTLQDHVQRKLHGDGTGGPPRPGPGPGPSDAGIPAASQQQSRPAPGSVSAEQRGRPSLDPGDAAQPAAVRTESRDRERPGSGSGQRGTVAREGPEPPALAPEGSPSQEESTPGTLQAALKSLERCQVNVSKGDFQAAMIYRNAGREKPGEASRPQAAATLGGTTPAGSAVIPPAAPTRSEPPSLPLSGPQDQAPALRLRPSLPPKPAHLASLGGPGQPPAPPERKGPRARTPLQLAEERFREARQREPSLAAAGAPQPAPAPGCPTGGAPQPAPAPGCPTGGAPPQRFTAGQVAGPGEAPGEGGAAAATPPSGPPGGDPSRGSPLPGRAGLVLQPRIGSPSFISIESVARKPAAKAAPERLRPDPAPALGGGVLEAGVEPLPVLPQPARSGGSGDGAWGLRGPDSPASGRQKSVLEVQMGTMIVSAPTLRR
ncbi:xin actin-binding repeat-containing protein 1 [Tachyglossus aculeatus]|uniref:xin actin-binding repeat-containing protein 1 n=1 Tax=Tachyglossus aculeatus TaxID=9261 RepID=UPI0018F75411|nr:xin actin-binding repeat-containing protein 1 [Tachyglossus aculeatus]